MQLPQTRPCQPSTVGESPTVPPCSTLSKLRRRVIAVSLTVYGAVYGYERLTWTNTAKCREFKRQYVEHAARKLRLIVDMTSANCSHQVQQELSSTFARLCHMVDESTTEMKDSARQIEQSVKELEETGTRAKVLKNQ